MRTTALVLAVMVWCAGSSSAAAAEPAGDQAALIQEVIRLSGLQDQLDRIPEQMQGQLEAHKDELSPAASTRIHAVMSSAFQRERLRASVAETFSQHADAGRLQQAADWLRGPLGSRMTALELAASRPEAEAALRDFIEQLQAAPPSPARVVLAKRLSAATSATDAAIKLMTVMVQGMAEAFDAAHGSGTSASRQQVQAALAQLRSQREVIEQGILIKLLFTYHDASEQELADCAAFWESDLGQWFSDLLVDAFIVALSGASQEMARELAPLVNAPSAGGP
ncbi:MAG: hypothetical protein HY599_05370 [Candidatus Omnitrophica bacterium]|nr:hypothetical protein [Candidatus Omnitrophota bacterium]